MSDNRGHQLFTRHIAPHMSDIRNTEQRPLRVFTPDGLKMSPLCDRPLWKQEPSGIYSADLTNRTDPGLQSSLMLQWMDGWIDRWMDG